MALAAEARHPPLIFDPSRLAKGQTDTGEQPGSPLS
jgi:hypothetical protein